MKVERLTVYFLISVGSGIGPATLASYLSAVSRICLTDASITLCSYARALMRSFCGAATAAFLARGLAAGFLVSFVVILLCSSQGKPCNLLTAQEIIFVTTPAP